MSKVKLHYYYFFATIVLLGGPSFGTRAVTEKRNCEKHDSDNNHADFSHSLSANTNSSELGFEIDMIDVFHPLGMRRVTISFNKDISIDFLEARSNVCSTGADDTGMVVWGPSIALSQYLISHPELVSRKRVLELGCGAAIPSMVSHRLEAADVIASDFRQQALEQVQYHAQMNDCLVQTELVDWETQSTLVDLHPEIVLAADVIYGLALVYPLVQTIQNILPKDSSLLIATRDGRTGIPEFRQMMRENFDEVSLLTSVDASYLPTIPTIIAEDPLSRHRWTGSYSIFAYQWRAKKDLTSG